MLDIIFDFFLEFIIAAPGAFILWAFKGFRGSFSDILNQNHRKSAIIGFVVWVLFFASIALVSNSL